MWVFLSGGAGVSGLLGVCVCGGLCVHTPSNVDGLLLHTSYVCLFTCYRAKHLIHIPRVAIAI